MIRLAIISLVIAAVLVILGFGGAAGTFVGIAKFLFFLAIALFVIFLVLDLLAGKGIKKAIDWAGGDPSHLRHAGRVQHDG